MFYGNLSGKGVKKIISLIKYFLIFALIIPAMLSDIRMSKIRNALILPFIPLGVTINFVLGGYKSAVSAISAIFIPIIALIIFYIVKMLGAADIKLFSAIGAIGGISFIIRTIAYSFLAGGLMALVIMIIRKNTKERFLYLFSYLESCILTLSILPYTGYGNGNTGSGNADGARFPFACAIVCGVVGTIIIEIYYK